MCSEPRALAVIDTKGRCNAPRTGQDYRAVGREENLLTRHKSEAASKLAEQNRLTHSGDGAIVDIAMSCGIQW